MDPCQHVSKKVSGIVNISRMAGHAAQQLVFLECPGLSQTGQYRDTVKSSIPDHRVDTAFWQTVSVRSQQLLCFQTPLVSRMQLALRRLFGTSRITRALFEDNFDRSSLVHQTARGGRPPQKSISEASATLSSH